MDSSAYFDEMVDTDNDLFEESSEQNWDGEQTEETIEEETDNNEEVENTQEDVTDDTPSINPNEQEEPNLPEYDYPEFIPEELKIREFKDEEEELKFYRENYTKIFDIVKSEEFTEHLMSAYEEQLLKQEDEVNELKAVKQLFKDNPEFAIKTFAPNYLLAKGHDPLYTEDEIVDVVLKKLEDEFGVDFQEKYNKEEAEKQGTLSWKMFQKQELYRKEVEDRNKELKELVEQYQPLSKEQQEERINKEYENSFKEHGMSKEEYDEFIKDLAEYGQKQGIDSIDYHRMLYFEDYMKAEYEKGLKDGKKGLSKEIETTSRQTYAIEKPKIVKQTKTPFSERNPWGDMPLGDPFAS